MLHNFNVAGAPITVFLTVLIDVDLLKDQKCALAVAYLITAFEFLTAIITIVLFVPFIRMIAHSAIFHSNLTRIFLFIAINMWFLEFAALLLIPYRLKFFPISVAWDLLAFLLSVYCFFVVFVEALIVPQFTIERMFATHYVSNYEQHKWPTISSTIILSVILINGFGACFMTLAFAYAMVATIAVAAPIYLALSAGTILAYKRLHTYNEDLSTRLTRDDIGWEYNLSLRFQVDENLRSLKLLHNLLIVLSGLNCFGALFGGLTFGVFALDSTPAQLFGGLFELWIVSYSPIFLVVVLWSVEEWRHEYSNYWRVTLHLLPQVIRPEKPNRDVEAEQYFLYYRQSWG
ncbi:unnamed protein product, partial [Mesorhabditis spiculigera]